MSDVARRKTILSLIEKGPGFLTAERSNDETNTVLDDLHFFWSYPVERSCNHLKAFELANSHIISFHHRARHKLLDKQLNQHRLDRFSTLRKSLQRKHAVVSVDNQRRKQVTFRIDQAIGIRFRGDLLPPCRGVENSPAPPLVDQLARRFA